MAEEGGETRQKRTVVEESPYSCLAFIQWENALEKLKILDYELLFCQPKNALPFTRTYFAVPADNAGLQFRSFQELASWLVEAATNDPELFKIDKYDDPTTSANKLMLALKTMSYGMDFPVSKLKQANGEAVCAVLDFLCDRALAKKRISLMPPVYTDEDLAEDAEVDEDADLGGGIEDEAEVQEEEEAMFEDLTKADETDEFRPDGSQYGICESNIDPVKWKEELERVGPKLRLAQRQAGKEWRSHVEETKKHEKAIAQAMPEAAGQLQIISAEVLDTLDKTRTKERYINNQQEALSAEHRGLKEELTRLEKTYDASNEQVNDLTNDLAVVSEEVEEMKERMDDRGGGGKMNEASPLVRIKGSLQQIKAEIKTFDLRIGVVSHSLLAAKVKTVREGSATRKGGGRGGRGGGGSGGGGGGGGGRRGGGGGHGRISASQDDTDFSISESSGE